MKYLTYIFLAIASTFAIVLLSLLSCSSHLQRAAPPPPTATASPFPPPSQISDRSVKAKVKIRNFKYEPANLAIAVGETVQFLNEDEEPHTVTSTAGAFNSKGLDTEETWNYTATKPGTFRYICSIHPFMKGTLTVTPKK